MADPRTLLAVHPSTDTHPRGWIALHDPSAAIELSRDPQMPCWVHACGCGRNYPLQPATVDRIAVLLAEAAALPAWRPQTPDPAPHGGTGTPRPQKGPQRASIADVVFGSDDVAGPTAGGAR